MMNLGVKGVGRVRCNVKAEERLKFQSTYTHNASHFYVYTSLVTWYL